MSKLNQEDIRAFYEKVKEVWPADDLWHMYSKNQIEAYLQKQNYQEDCYVLNAGSGGNSYGLLCNMHHVDIAKNKIEIFKEYTVANIESMPFANEQFQHAICVGSVLNYCDAFSAISELSRVISHRGSLIIEFDSSYGWAHIGTKYYKSSANIVNIQYRGEEHRHWVYSPNYIENILKTMNFEILHRYGFHYLSGLHSSIFKSDNKAARFAIFDSICRHMPFVKYYANNMIFLCAKK